ncbi:hypothetical protein D9619_007552 [Psilocybe cf. subviscida]|uniref:Alginate lyase domain-containing protein n=1 Tax=Psilocybe cf. subviscida TaxID=2480587 RepID=A0A8H5B3C7_9AGAR|nr:hypothetical protein D9619_007552 [Psilocybe cf. subviscida]
MLSMPSLFRTNTFLSTGALLLAFLSSTTYIQHASAQTAYAADFIEPTHIIGQPFDASRGRAMQSVVSWAQQLAEGGPWSVVNKFGKAPSGDMHDYLSWAPYWWPDCSSVGNTTVLSDEQIWVTCPYVNRDGQFNPDGRLVNNVGDFQSMAEATLYNAVAWSFNETWVSGTLKTQLETNAVKFIRTWFLDPDTAMKPNLNYAQMKRGPGIQVGSHTGVLDLKAMSKITSAILLLRSGKSALWTPQLDAQMVAWTQAYIGWLESAAIAIEEKEALNNHGTFYFSQLASLKVLVNDLPGAKGVCDEFFNGIYKGQIQADGEQPLEAARTRPYHYRAYNLAGMITIARIAAYAAPSSSPWSTPSGSGATIQKALDFAITTSAATSKEGKYAEELWPNVASVASVYGDAEGKYLAYLKKNAPGFMSEPYILWNAPFGAGEASGVIPPGAKAATRKATGAAAASTGAKDAKDNTSAGMSLGGAGMSAAAVVAAVTVGGLSLLL